MTVRKKEVRREETRRAVGDMMTEYKTSMKSLEDDIQQKQEDLMKMD